MEAASPTELPTGPEWQYEPKWDGFRCLAFRDRDSPSDGVRNVRRNGNLWRRGWL
jgi:ATP-dependent DNA ligase